MCIDQSQYEIPPLHAVTLKRTKTLSATSPCPSTTNDDLLPQPTLQGFRMLDGDTKIEWIECKHPVTDRHLRHYMLVEEQRRLVPGVANGCRDVLPLPHQLDVGVIKQQPLVQLLAQGVCLQPMLL